MGSKQLQSILKNIPSATVRGEDQIIHDNTEKSIEKISSEQTRIIDKNTLPVYEKVEVKQSEEEYDRIVAEIPKSLKRAIRLHLQENKGLTEKGVLLKALSLYGFEIDEKWLVDKRTTR